CSSDLILNHSTVPLRLATYFGLATSVFTVILMLFYAIGRLVLQAHWPAGFTTLAALVLLSISINAMLLGIIGEYLGRMYRQVREAPISIIESVIDHAPQGRQTFESDPGSHPLGRAASGGNPGL
ncbi:MAG: hypothetical protein ACLGQX_10570, partial [Acidobacteriota bacterium]